MLSRSAGKGRWSVPAPQRRIHAQRHRDLVPTLSMLDDKIGTSMRRPLVGEFLHFFRLINLQISSSVDLHPAVGNYAYRQSASRKGGPRRILASICIRRGRFEKAAELESQLWEHIEIDKSIQSSSSFQGKLLENAASASSSSWHYKPYARDLASETRVGARRSAAETSSRFNAESSYIRFSDHLGNSCWGLGRNVVRGDTTLRPAFIAAARRLIERGRRD